MITYISAENYVTCMLAIISKVICSSVMCCLPLCTISNKLEHTFLWYFCFISNMWQLYSYFLLHVSVSIGHCKGSLPEYWRPSRTYGFFFQNYLFTKECTSDCLKNDTKIYIKITPTYFGVVIPSSGNSIPVLAKVTRC